MDLQLRIGEFFIHNSKKFIHFILQDYKQLKNGYEKSNTADYGWMGDRKN